MAKPVVMRCFECTAVERKEAFDVLSGRFAGIKFQALISPLPATRNYRGGRLVGAAIADREDGSSYYYNEQTWTETDDPRVKALLEELHDFADNWR